MRRVEPLLDSYGDLIFDLCHSVLNNAEQAQSIFRRILRIIQKNKELDGYRQYRRAFALRIAFQELRLFAANYRNPLTPIEQIKLDAAPSVTIRLQEFGSYFRRLSPEEQILLLFKDKYGLPFSEISAAMGAPEGSLKIRRQQALRTLEEWLWDQQ